MKLSKMIQNLKEVMIEHGDLECIYSIDDEGNAFHEVHHIPSVGYFKDDEFYIKDDLEELFDIDVPRNAKINVVCIN